MECLLTRSRWPDNALAHRSPCDFVSATTKPFSGRTINLTLSMTSSLPKFDTRPVTMTPLTSAHASKHDPHNYAYVERSRRHQDKLLRLLESNPQNTQDPVLSAGISAIADGRRDEGMLDTISAFPGLLPRFQEGGSQVIVFKVVAPRRLFSQDTN